MTSSAAITLAVVIFLIFGVAGILAGVLWRRWGYLVPRIFRVIGAGLSALGVWLVLAQSHQLKEWGALAKWPLVEGAVVSSRVAGERARHPEIIYEYSVAGSTYRDTTSFDTPSFGGKSVKEDESEAIVARFPAGARVSVHYDPQAPSRSLLRISADWSHYGKIGLGGVLLGIGLFLITAAQGRPH